MSRIVVIELVCDGPNCYKAWPADYSDTGSLAAQRAAAKAAGWRVARPGGLDFCPDHPARRHGIDPEAATT